jgi:hypothetical protein
MRMRTNTPEMRLALSRLYAVSNAVDKQDWAAAGKAIAVLRTHYGRSAAK